MSKKQKRMDARTFYRDAAIRAVTEYHQALRAHDIGAATEEELRQVERQYGATISQINAMDRVGAGLPTEVPATFAQMERQFSDGPGTLSTDRFEAAGLAYREDDPESLEELKRAALWLGIIDRQSTLLIDLAQYEAGTE